MLWQNVPYEWALHMDDDANDHARAKRELRSFINTEAKFLKKYVPGFEDATIANVGRFVGVRDGRHPIGEHVFSLEDVLAGRTFRDAVTKPMTKTFHWGGFQKHTFEVSYRSFLPKGIDNLLLTGASLSFTYNSLFMVMRNFPWCTQTGEIAGYVAAPLHRPEHPPQGIRVRHALFLSWGTRSVQALRGPKHLDRRLVDFRPRHERQVGQLHCCALPQQPAHTDLP